MKNLLFILLGFFLFNGCDKTETTTPKSISGAWKVGELDGSDVSKFKGTLIIQAPKKQMSGTSGCNIFGGDIVLLDSVALTLNFGPTITTKIGCANELGVFEQNYYNALDVVDGFDIKNNALYLIEKGKTRLILSKQ
jgi:heat shock protein HslJ